VEIHTDPDKVLHVLVNFLGNALKFTQEGRVGVRLLHDDRGVVYEVWDTGPGIPREHRDHIFQEFAQLETKTTGRKGTGLGLAICARFAEMVEGKVELDSWVGRGSVFRLILPRGGEEADCADPTRGGSRPAPRPEAPDLCAVQSTTARVFQIRSRSRRRRRRAIFVRDSTSSSQWVWLPRGTPAASRRRPTSARSPRAPPARAAR
jgi:anti-sigma regulatory factor (Ser/Thr protein kinase)